ncbi:TRAP transporter TatT component family protein [uncultured Azonexus sp.]|uniref:TRAP transporter TatT component family protein n=1 Tax=uncultured Azonexus sp. TaxID=520307 RepID=UPI002636CC29|nr:TRAP transporter TatT component family protein [uncultured Azonexus sp.]
MSRLKSLFFALGVGFSTLLQAAPDDLIRPIQDRWAEIKYRQPEDRQADLYRELAVQARQVAKANPNLAAALIWEAIVVSSEAGVRGGLGGLSLAKEARALLEESLKLDEKSLNGSAYTSLATLYAKVPRWPLGFGDKEKAEALFRKSLAVNPDGIDPNFFYGEYLIDQDRVTEGRRYLEKALVAPARPGRELADQGRRQEARALLAKTAGDVR